MADDPTRDDVGGAEIGARQAADVLGITLAHVNELARNGVLRSRDGAEGLLVRRSDVETFADRRRRQLAAARGISDIVNRSSEGWDS